MNSIKTFKDIENDERKEREALALFTELYSKYLNLGDKELDFIKESANSAETDDRSIDKMLEELSNEGLIGGLVGGIGGLAFGSKIGAAICKALGVTQGPLYSLLTSKVMTTAICTYLGLKA